jgi:hypothetical protein
MPMTRKGKYRCTSGRMFDGFLESGKDCKAYRHENVQSAKKMMDCLRRYQEKYPDDYEDILLVKYGEFVVMIRKDVIQDA